MPTPFQLNTKAVRGSSFVINMIPKDEDGTAITPDSLEYTLTDPDGNVINSLSGISLTPSTSIDLMLSGDDLEFESAEEGAYEVIRIITVTGVYDSAVELNVPLIDSATFYVVDPNKLG